MDIFLNKKIKKVKKSQNDLWQLLFTTH